jgi:hypothetical protein
MPRVTLANVMDMGPIKSPEAIRIYKILETVTGDEKRCSPVDAEMSCHKESNDKRPKTLEIIDKTFMICFHRP